MTNNNETPNEYRPSFPLSADDMRIAAREDEYIDYLECLKIAAESQS